MRIAAVGLYAAAGLGLGLYLVQLVSTFLHLRQRRASGTSAPGISILKPLCGVDDELEANLTAFATLAYPHYELLLGVCSTADRAWPLACALARRWPGRVRVVVQRGEPGLNPKVNQLITLAAVARHDVVVISDSNVRPPDGYLEEIAAALSDGNVGLVTHPVVGIGERRLGSLFDNLHLGSSVGPGMVATKRVARRDLVVGKSMALRKTDLATLGGFEAVKDVLAEDWVLGKWISERLGKRVVVAHRPVYNVSAQRSVRDFLHRYRRWSVIHKKAVGLPVYLAQLVLNPTLLALGAAVLTATSDGWLGFGFLAVGKAGYDVAATGVLRGPGGLGATTLSVLAAPLKDLVLGWAWLHGLTHSTVSWRHNRLRVCAGTRLEPLWAQPELDEGAYPEVAG